MLATCEGTISTSVDGAALCLDGLGAPLTWTPWDWATVVLDPAQASIAFGAGVFIALAFWVAASGVVLLVRSLASLMR